jgi:hypothetical protein
MAIATVTQPKYTCTLPVQKAKVEYRPFTVKEEKILLLAQEDGSPDAMLNAINQIISNCTFTKHNIDTLNKVDAEYLFVQIRNKSLGEGAAIRAICKECKEKTPMTLNLEDVVVVNADKKNEAIMIQENLWVTLKIPSIRESMELTSADGTIALALSLDTVIEGESLKNTEDYTLEERVEFIESLNNNQLNSFKEYIDNFPYLQIDVTYICGCGCSNTINIKGIENFF